MKAAWYDAQGDAEKVIQVGSFDKPICGDNEVIVKIFASGINPSDVKRRMGSRGKMEYPKIIPHSDGAGIIETIGKNIDPQRLGERVWVYNGQWNRPFGTAAEYISINQELAIHLPNNIDFEIGACLGIPAFTAHRAVFGEGTVTNKVVLVTGGAGSVGYFAIQMAKWGGARVIATVSSDEKAKMAKEAGADFVLNYKTQNIANQVMMLTGDGVDHIVEVDFGGNLETNVSILKINGSISTYASMGNTTPILPFYPLMQKSINIRLIFVYDLPKVARLSAVKDITQMLKDNSLNAKISHRFKLDDIVEAHKIIESGKTNGNVIINKF